MNTGVEAETMLAIDVGSVNTRASLFDVVDGRFRLVATGRAATTAAAPLLDISEGVRQAIDQIQSVTGRPLVDESENLIMPASSSGAGVDMFVATASAGPKVRAVLVGMMPGVSMQSLRRLADASYVEIVGEVLLTDRRREEERIDLIRSARPDLVLMAGGTDRGAGQSVLRIAESIGLALGMSQDEDRPQVVFAGNRLLGQAITEVFGPGVPVLHAPNIRPSLEVEDLSPARQRVSEAIAELRSSRINGLEELRQWSGGHMLLTADGFGRVLRYLGHIYDPRRGVLGVDVGASHVTLAASFGGSLHMTVRTDLGLGASLPGLLRHADLEDIQRWLPVEMPLGRVRDYIYNKSLRPGTVPAEKDELHLEFALARELLRVALVLGRPSWPKAVNRTGFLPPMERIVASGGVLSRTPRPGYAALALLDALQPTGVVTMVLDPYNLAPSLGAAMSTLPMASVQVLESGSFVSLGTVVSPVGRAKVGRPILHLRLERDDGEVTEGVIRYGQLTVVPMGPSLHGRLMLRPERGFDVGFGGPGKAGTLRVFGSSLGLVVDARGRPLPLPRDPERRRDLNHKWLWDIGAVE
ncbi:MAG: glutamate mutase L [Anaerolineales bacterium]|nr:glutamate mutase L [Anaerolineales bacterium]